MLYDHTIAHSARETGGVLLRDDRSQVQINATSHSRTAETDAHVDLPHKHVAARCPAAAGRQGCSFVSS